jgi:alpha-galactosidase
MNCFDIFLILFTIIINPKFYKFLGMKFKVFTIAICFILFLTSCSGSRNRTTVNINTQSHSKNVVSNVRVEKLNGNTKFISIGLTNQGEKTEFIQNIQIQLNDNSQFAENSKFLYGGFDMGNGVIQQRAYNDQQLKTETVLLVKNDNTHFFKTGILTWEIFRPEITFSKEQGITIFADGENKPIKPGETIQFEKIVVETGSNWQDMLYAYSDQIAKVQNIQPKKINQFKGWSTWDYYGQRFNDKDIAMNIKLLKELKVDANMIQIDGGWWKLRGDYLDSRTDIAGGMQGVAQLISDNGYTPGIHLDGFRAEKASEVYKSHPDWFLKDQNGETFYSETKRPNRIEQSVYFDYSNPAARDYIKNVLKTIREKWGYKYFKIDFMWYGLNKDIFEVQQKLGLNEIRAYDPTMTSIERTRAGLKAMREGIASGYFLGCSSMFGTTFGIVDGLRAGPDIDPKFEAFSNRSLHNAGGFYLNKTLVQTDADYLVLRSKEDEEAERAWDVGRKFGGNLTLDEAKMWSDYVSLFGGIKISSDNLNVLRTERKKLIKNAFSLNTCTRYIPIDLWDKAKDLHDAFNIMLGTNDQGVFLALFNWNNEELVINLSNIPTNNLEAINNDNNIDFIAQNDTLKIKLKPHTSLIFKLNSEADFDKVRNQLEYKFNN